MPRWTAHLQIEDDGYTRFATLNHCTVPVTFPPAARSARPGLLPTRCTNRSGHGRREDSESARIAFSVSPPDRFPPECFMLSEYDSPRSRACELDSCGAERAAPVVRRSSAQKPASPTSTTSDTSRPNRCPRFIREARICHEQRHGWVLPTQPASGSGGGRVVDGHLPVVGSVGLKN